MKTDYSRVLALIDRIYGAATDDEAWPAILAETRALLDCQAGTLLFTDNNLKPVDNLFKSNLPSESIQAYQDYYHTLDIRLHRAMPQSIGKIVTDADLVDETIVNRHEFFQDFLRPNGLRYIVSAVMDLDDGSFAFASFHRGLKQEHADRDSVDLARLLIPHIKRGLQLRQNLGVLRLRERAAFDVLDQFIYAVFLVDRSGSILWQNRMSDRVLAARDGLSAMDGTLRTDQPRSNAELTALIKSAIDALDSPCQIAGGMMTVARPSLARAYQVLVTPLSRSPADHLGAQALRRVPGAVVFVTDPEISGVPKAPTIVKLFNLTPAEARLATALASGISIKSYAEREGRSIHYVRWLLKQVEAKTDTRRLADLVRLLTSQTGFHGLGEGEDGDG